MNHKINYISGALAAMASILFVGGILVLTGGEPNDGNGKRRISSVDN